ncbi:LINE-1 reverse transcriptase [Sesamum angolense]|uniref:LINE-1 reverse transcriptase n=1 Tax=Sesamum angolense TaxID=2727404 RepID=A0AAE1T8S2_9LAMI|nr:LINE-1 reverse transcriptase [Sesamum angolense]
MEENMLHQRSKLQWLKHGDQNSKIFFRKVNSMRAKQRIFQISTPTGDTLTDMKEVTDEFVSNQDAVFDIAEDSAQVRMNIRLVFFKASWSVVGKEVSEAVSEYFRTGKLLKQELLAGYNQAKLPPRCTIKVDIQKAYDSVDWDFLTAVLKLFEFPDQFIGWIEQCVTTASFSISLNGSIYGFFPGARGLRQGDPMSPYLFVLIMEIWHTLLHFRVHAVPLFQFHWKCKEQRILDLCFADDVLVFCKADIPSITVIKDTLCEFAELSGLKVNPHKSQIILSRAAQQDKQQILELLGFQEGCLPVRLESPQSDICWPCTAHQFSSEHTTFLLGIGLYPSQRNHQNP